MDNLIPDQVDVILSQLALLPNTPLTLTIIETIFKAIITILTLQFINDPTVKYKDDAEQITSKSEIKLFFS